MDKYFTVAAILFACVAITHGSVLNRVKRTFEGKEIDDVVGMLGPRKEVDIILLVDRSRGMEMDNFYLKEKRLLERILRQYPTVSADYARVAAVTFAEDVEVAFDSISLPLASSINKAQLFSGNEPMWDRMVYYHDINRFTETNVKLGLEEVADIFSKGRYNRPTVSQVLILSTDGDYDNFDPTVAVAQQLDSDGVNIFGIGVGPWISGNSGNVQALTSEDGYYAEYNVWQRMTESEEFSSNFKPEDTKLLEILPLGGGYCGGTCKNHSQCNVDVDTATESCLCLPGYYLKESLDEPGTMICSPCPLHKYKSEVGDFACRQCPLPMYTNTTGNRALTDCICPIDVINQGDQDEDCIDQCEGQCGENQACDYTGSRTWECRRCEVGWINTAGANVDTVECVMSEDDCTVRGNSVCLNGAKCVDLHNDYMCVCAQGYTGRNCELMDDPCDTGICINNGNCTATAFNMFECDCPYGWGGRFCALVETTTVTTTIATTPTTTVTTPTPTIPSTTPTPTSTEASTPTSTLPSTAPSTSTTTEEPTPTAAERKEDKEDDNMLYIIIGAAAAGGLLLLIILILIICVCCRRKEEPPVKEVEANGTSDGSRLYRKNKNVKTFSNRFSDFWRKKTLTPGSFSADGVKGLPSVPPRRRPDLLGHVDEDGFSTIQSDHEMEYAVFDNQTVQDTSGMEGWQRYVTDIAASGLVEKASIVKIKGKRRALSDEWDWDDSEINKILIIMENKDYNVPALMQSDEYHIHSNDGTVASGRTIGSSAEPRVISIGKTQDFLIIGIANGNKDSGQCLKEVQWITDHIKNEGY